MLAALRDATRRATVATHDVERLRAPFLVPALDATRPPPLVLVRLRERHLRREREGLAVGRPATRGGLELSRIHGFRFAAVEPQQLERRLALVPSQECNGATIRRPPRRARPVGTERELSRPPSRDVEHPELLLPRPARLLVVVRRLGTRIVTRRLEHVDDGASVG